MTEKLKTIHDPALPILIVDDNVQYTQVLKRILEKALGYSSVSSVDSTAAALEMLRSDQGHHRLLFIDYHFPGGETGGRLLERLRQEGLLEGRIAFLITSEPTVENLKQAIAAGAIGVVAKPFDREDLRKQLEKAERALIVDSSESF